MVQESMADIKEIILHNAKSFKSYNADCIILTHDNKLLMQKRSNDWKKFPNAVCFFGGHGEKGEQPLATVQREIHEELGVRPQAQDLKLIGAVSESITNHMEAIYIYVWHDKNQQITGCYEGDPIYFDTIDEALAHPEIMDYAVWALNRYKKTL